MDEMPYRNEGPLWPCGCLMGSPYCECPGETVGDMAEAVEASGGEMVIDGYVVRLLGRFPAGLSRDDPDPTTAGSGAPHE